MSEPAAQDASARDPEWRPAGIDLGRLFPIDSPWRGYRWLVGAAILTTLLALFWFSGVFDLSVQSATDGSYSPALFFSVIVAYIVPIFGYITARTERALDQVSPFLIADPAQIHRWRTRLRLKPVRWLVIVLLIAAVSGCLHNLVLYGGLEVWWRNLAAMPRERGVTGGTLLVWFTVTMVVAGLLDNVLIFSRAARCCRVDLLDTLPLRPFANVAVSSTLAIIGAQAAFPILGLEGELDPLAFVPGLIATSGPMLLLAAMPVWPVHRRIADTRARTLAALNGQIRALQPDDPADPEPARLAALTPLLAYRREVQAVSEWPFDLGVMTRLALYLIIPPLTWVGAALIENMVDTFL